MKTLYDFKDRPYKFLGYSGHYARLECMATGDLIHIGIDRMHTVFREITAH